MVWDTFGEHLAREGARMLDTLPFLSEPTSRAFTGEQPVPTVFFFLNLFAHIGIPLAMGVVFWLHVKRLARPHLLPPRPLLWMVVGVLTATAIVWPLEMAPEANPFVLPASVPADLFFAFWMPLAAALSGGQALVAAAVCGLALLAVPWFTARRGDAAPAPSVVDEDICVGCVQCSLDCPYGAITMFARVSRRSDLVARVDPRSLRELRHLRRVVRPDGRRAAGQGRTRSDRRGARVRRRPGTARRRGRRHQLRSRRRGVCRRRVGGRRRALSHRLCRQSAHVGHRDASARGGRRRAGSRLSGRATAGIARGRAGSARACTAGAKPSCSPGSSAPVSGSRTSARANEAVASTPCARLPPKSPPWARRRRADAADAEVQCEPALVARDA